MLSKTFARRKARSGYVLTTGAILAAFAISTSAMAQDLTLADALSRTATVDPAIAVNAARLRAADATITQAGIRPRDAIGIEIEDFAGTGPYAPGSRAQTTLWYERIWERGGKREARIGAARAGLGNQSERNRIRMLNVLAQVQSAWVEALAAEAVIPIAEQRLTAATQAKAEIDRRVARALDPLFTAERAGTVAAQARIALDQAQEHARIARATLASFWGGNADYHLDLAAFGKIETTSPLTSGSPDLTLLTAERDKAAANMRLAETGNFGDPAIRVGVRHFGQGNDVAVMVGGSIPLGSSTANRGNVERAQAERQAADAEIAVARVEHRRNLDRLTAERAAIAAEIAEIDQEVLPRAERAAILVQRGLAHGGTAFTFLEVNQAQQAVADAKAHRVELLRRFHLAGAQLDRLTGRHASLLSNAENR